MARVSEKTGNWTMDEPFAMSEARLTAESLWIKSAPPNVVKAVPKYSVEVAFENNDPYLDELANKIFDAGDRVLPAGWDQEFKVEGAPFISGDKRAAEREAADKPGDAYKGMTLIRAGTQFNYLGQDADGGAEVYDAKGDPVEMVNRSQVYAGCYGKMGADILFYQETKTKIWYASFYLKGFQKTKDGERFASFSNNSGLFDPVEGYVAPGASQQGRGRRRPTED